jgi:hypothetical protein
MTTSSDAEGMWSAPKGNSRQWVMSDPATTVSCHIEQQQTG